MALAALDMAGASPGHGFTDIVLHELDEPLQSGLWDYDREPWPPHAFLGDLEVSPSLQAKKDR
jgi:hypothetical protein